jgi:hypothetical protein
MQICFLRARFDAERVVGESIEHNGSGGPKIEYCPAGRNEIEVQATMIDK